MLLWDLKIFEGGREDVHYKSSGTSFAGLGSWDIFEEGEDGGMGGIARG